MSYYIQIYREPSVTPVEIPVSSIVEGMIIIDEPKKLGIELRNHDVVTLATSGVPVSYCYIFGRKGIKKLRPLTDIFEVSSRNCGTLRASDNELNSIKHCGVAWNTFWHHLDAVYSMMACAYNSGLDKSLIAKTMMQIMDAATENEDKEDTYTIKSMRDIACAFLEEKYKSESKASAAFNEINEIYRSAKDNEMQSAASIFRAYSAIPMLWIHKNSASVTDEFIFGATLVRQYYTGDSPEAINRMFAEIIRSNIKLEMILKRI